uniref:Uncharacterized protein n=1 Tax=Candidatus Kentrum sp. TC TaxID=2126339 RepID=A0A450Y9R8_9GAMM|nr:MAG: hypothetical protein BECKTC1821D_GA0114238_100422 [Candidatus Kentron sp. TC]
MTLIRFRRLKNQSADLSTTLCMLRIRSAGVGWNFAFVFTMILNPGIFSAYLICISLLVLQLREFLMKI